MKKDRRWLKSLLAASQEPQIGLPFQRGLRRRPKATKIDLRVAMKPRAMAAMTILRDTAGSLRRSTPIPTAF